MTAQDAEFVDLQERHRAAVLHHVFHLAQIVYVPADGRGDSVVGEELLDWVNYVNVGALDTSCCQPSTFFDARTAPRSDDLQALKQLGNPFDEDFEGAWDCVNRSAYSTSR